MKILLLGEFSSFHKYLKDGLVKLGHNATIAAGGDGFKKIKYDYNLGSGKNGLFGKFISLIRQIKVALQSGNFDIVQLIQPCVFPNKYSLNQILLNIIFKNCNSVFLVGAGADDYNSYIADYRENYDVYPEYYKQLLKSLNCDKLYSQTPSGIKFHNWLHERITGYIPIMYEYAEPYRLSGYKKLCPTIPIPINLDEVKYQPNVVRDKIVIFHGLNRPLVKGTPIIQEAFEKLQKDYPNDVETVIDGKMPLKDYLELMKRTNVTIDQTYCVSSGVNGLLSMAMGKVTLGGGEAEGLKEFGVTDCPMIPIKPDSNDIYDRLVEIIKRKNEITVIGEKSRKYIEEVHDYVKIAQKYVDIWSSY